MGSQRSVEAGRRIMHAILENNDLVLMGTDMTSQEGFIPGNDISIALGFDSEKSIRTCYFKLSAGSETGSGQLAFTLAARGATAGIMQQRLIPLNLFVKVIFFI
ncbi:MAG TPA: hypothetical protein VK040_08260 [Balneolaceae bacterium]|nr:hypothetical protein [Balneolaceae bacterium]